MLLSLLSLSFLGFAKKPDTRYFELRIYYCLPGRLDALIERFTNHTTKIFEKHGMTNVGYWIPNKNDDNALYYILAYPNQAARDSSWKQFGRDPEWKEVAKKSEESGKIVAKVVNTFMNATDFSPKIKASKGSEDRTFEMRTYTTHPGKLDALNARFRDHTTRIFKKHGMENVGYWVPQDEPGHSNTLIYIIAHKSREAAKASWDAFRADPEWKKVAAESEASGKIVAKVESVFMDSVDYSPIK